MDLLYTHKLLRSKYGSRPEKIRSISKKLRLYLKNSSQICDNTQMTAKKCFTAQVDGEPTMKKGARSNVKPTNKPHPHDSQLLTANGTHQLRKATTIFLSNKNETHREKKTHNLPTKLKSNPWRRLWTEDVTYGNVRQRRIRSNFVPNHEPNRTDLVGCLKMRIEPMFN